MTNPKWNDGIERCKILKDIKSDVKKLKKATPQEKSSVASSIDILLRLYNC